MSRITEAINKAAKKVAPLSMKEEARLNTLSHCVTMALFRSYDMCKQMRTMKGREDRFLRGWGRQCMNKIVDDELFGANVDTLTQIAQTQLSIPDPIANVYNKAMLGVAARLMTLTVMVPFQNVTDPAKRRVIIKNVPRVPLYHGFVRQSVKECVFTATYVLSSTFVGDYLTARRTQIRDRWAHCLTRVPRNIAAPDNGVKRTEDSGAKSMLGDMYGAVINPFATAKPQEPASAEPARCRCRKAQCSGSCSCADVATELTIASAKAAAGGLISTLAVCPIDYFNKPKKGMVQATLAKAGRKASYNAVNASLAKTMQKGAIHRVLARTVSANYLPSKE